MFQRVLLDTGTSLAMSFAPMSDRCSSTARYSTRTTVPWGRPDMGCAVSSKCVGPRLLAHHLHTRKRIAEARFALATPATVLPTSTTKPSRVSLGISSKRLIARPVFSVLCRPRSSGRLNNFNSNREKNNNKTP